MKKYIVLSVITVLVLAGGYIALKVPCPFSQGTQETSTLPDLPKSAQFKHPKWTDTMIFDSATRAHRSSRVNETAKIIKRTENELVLSWDNWGIETFKRLPNGSYTLAD